MSIETGERFNTGKPKITFNLSGKEVQAGEAAVWEAGAKKYSRGNWLKGTPWTDSCDSALRHIMAFLAGEDLDPETGLPHVDHLVCSAKIISNSFHTRKDLDDRENVDETSNQVHSKPTETPNHSNAVRATLEEQQQASDIFNALLRDDIAIPPGIGK